MENSPLLITKLLVSLILHLEFSPFALNRFETSLETPRSRCSIVSEGPTYWLVYSTSGYFRTEWMFPT